MGNPSLSQRGFFESLYPKTSRQTFVYGTAVILTAALLILTAVLTAESNIFTNNASTPASSSSDTLTCSPACDSGAFCNTMTGRCICIPPQCSQTQSPTQATALSTAVPTTALPTTALPTNAVPTTAAPTTANKPTTNVPTTAVPTTAVPTNAVPTTALPTTAVPTNAVPTTAIMITPILTSTPTVPATATATATPTPCPQNFQVIASLLTGKSACVPLSFLIETSLQSIVDVEWVGDVNSDGFADLVFVGATNTGSIAVVVFGSNLTNNVDYLSINIAQNNANWLTIDTSSNLAQVVSNAGDCNNDGVDDIVLLSSSEIFIVFGSPSFSQQTSISLHLPFSGLTITVTANSDTIETLTATSTANANVSILDADSFSNTTYLFIVATTIDDLLIPFLLVPSLITESTVNSVSLTSSIEDVLYDSYLSGVFFLPLTDKGVTGMGFSYYGLLDGQYYTITQLFYVDNGDLSNYNKTSYPDSYGTVVEAFSSLSCSFNNDSIADVILFDKTLKKLSIYFNSDDIYNNLYTNAKINLQINDPSAFSALTAADINGDQLPDIILALTDSVYVFLGPISDTSTPNLNITDTVLNTEHNSVQASGFAFASASGDFNGDGYQDYLMSDGVNIYIRFGSSQPA